MAHDDPLSRNVLRLVNSDSAEAHNGPVQSVTEALHLLGRDRLRHWLEILLAAVPASMSYAAQTVPRSSAACSSLPLRCRFQASHEDAAARAAVNWA